MKVDYGIITMKEEEFLALQGRLPDAKLLAGPNHHYFTASVDTRTGGVRRLALARCVGQGQGEALSVASDLIADLDPAWLLLVGIAGAVPAEEFGLGDVLLASRLHDFSIHAALEGRAPELDVAGGPVHPSVARLLSILPGVQKELGPWNSPEGSLPRRPALKIPRDIANEHYYGDHLWRQKVRKCLRTRFRDPRDAHRPCLRIGAVASSNALVKDTELVERWKAAARSVTHIEMELGGVYRAASRRHVPVLSVRGISDVVGFRRDAEWTEYACQTAAAFALALVASDLPFFGVASPARPAPAIVDLSGSDPEDLPGKFRAVEITWDINPDDFTPEMERQLLSTVAHLTKVSEVVVLRRRFGSVKITVALTQEQIEAFRIAAEAGAVESAGIRAADIVPLDEVFTEFASLHPAPPFMTRVSGLSQQLGEHIVRDREAHDLSRNPEFDRFQFLGYRTSAAAVELVALCDADGLAEGDVVRLRDEFFDLVRRLPHEFGLKPRGRNPNGLLGFVYADGCPEPMARFIARQTRIDHAAGTGGVSVAWAIDVRNGRIHTHDNPVSIFPPVVVLARTVYPGLEYLQGLLPGLHAVAASASPPPPSPQPDSINLLFLAANSQTMPLELDREWVRIETDLRRAKVRDRVFGKALWEASMDQLMQALLDESPHILHFSGHGRTDGILLRSDSGGTQVVSGAALARMLKLFKGTLRCVVLNACWSEPQARAIREHVPHVVGLRDRILDTEALAFSAGFYKAIAAGKDVPFAFELAAANVEALGHGGEKHLVLL